MIKAKLLVLVLDSMNRPIGRSHAEDHDDIRANEVLLRDYAERKGMGKDTARAFAKTLPMITEEAYA